MDATTRGRGTAMTALLATSEMVPIASFALVILCVFVVVEFWLILHRG